MATTYESFSEVRSGYYLDAASWRIEPVAHDGDRLPAGRGRWVRLPTAAALLLVPVVGAAFLVALPFIGFATFARAIGAKLRGGVRRGATELASTVEPGRFAAGHAHFTGKPGGEAEEGEAPGAEVDAIEKEIAARRGEPR